MPATSPALNAAYAASTTSTLVPVAIVMGSLWPDCAARASRKCPELGIYSTAAISSEDIVGKLIVGSRNVPLRLEADRTSYDAGNSSTVLS